MGIAWFVIAKCYSWFPVAVSIHGGGFECAANTQITSNAAGLAATGRMVSVSVGYRLGAVSLSDEIDCVALRGRVT